jgi:hypothetical protein
MLIRCQIRIENLNFFEFVLKMFKGKREKRGKRGKNQNRKREKNIRGRR